MGHVCGKDVNQAFTPPLRRINPLQSYRVEELRPRVLEDHLSQTSNSDDKGDDGVGFDGIDSASPSTPSAQRIPRLRENGDRKRLTPRHKRQRSAVKISRTFSKAYRRWLHKNRPKIGLVRSSLERPRFTQVALDLVEEIEQMFAAASSLSSDSNIEHLALVRNRIETFFNDPNVVALMSLDDGVGDVAFEKGWNRLAHLERLVSLLETTARHQQNMRCHYRAVVENTTTGEVVVPSDGNCAYHAALALLAYRDHPSTARLLEIYPNVEALRQGVYYFLRDYQDEPTVAKYIMDSMQNVNDDITLNIRQQLDTLRVLRDDGTLSSSEYATELQRTIADSSYSAARSCSEYLDKVQQRGFWAGSAELYAISCLFQCSIRILIKDDRTGELHVSKFHPRFQPPLTRADSDDKPIDFIFIGDHYNAKVETDAAPSPSCKLCFHAIDHG